MFVLIHAARVSSLFWDDALAAWCQTQVQEENWRDLVDHDGTLVTGRDGLPSRVLVSARYIKGESDGSFSTMC